MIRLTMYILNLLVIAGLYYVLFTTTNVIDQVTVIIGLLTTIWFQLDVIFNNRNNNL